ncbi:Cytochrome P450 [Penicillium viridicatum]|nr:Cytochrome P450 [Penicillium viridicatum]
MLTVFFVFANPVILRQPSHPQARNILHLELAGQFALEAKIILTYDVRIAERTTPIMEMGFEMLSDPDAKLEIRKRNIL